jgi:hypothetical protein
LFASDHRQVKKRPTEQSVFFYFISDAADRNRTDTTVARREILSQEQAKKPTSDK